MTMPMHCLREQLHQLARRVRDNGYRQGMESFVLEREDIADTIERMVEECCT
jgi:hypothetical protein